MTAYEMSVLFEREGDTGPEVGVLVDGHSVEFIDGTRIKLEEGDYVDPIGRSVEAWSEEALRALHSGLVARTERQRKHLQS